MQTNNKICSEKNSEMLGIKPRAAGCGARMLPLRNAAHYDLILYHKPTIGRSGSLTKPVIQNRYKIYLLITSEAHIKLRRRNLL